MSPALRRLFFTCVIVLFVTASVFAQTESRGGTEAGGGSSPSTPPRNTPINPKYTTPKSPLDTAYGAKIAEYTTEKYFMTELVDHLPLSDKVPSPDKVLGYAVGTPNKLTYTKDLYRYYRELAKASPRVRVLTAPEKSEAVDERVAFLFAIRALSRRCNGRFGGGCSSRAQLVDGIATSCD